MCLGILIPWEEGKRRDVRSGRGWKVGGAGRGRGCWEEVLKECKRMISSRKSCVHDEDDKAVFLKTTAKF